jgi:beta-glucanase (GH16 family)
MLLYGNVGKIVVVHRDRLCRFGKLEILYGYIESSMKFSEDINVKTGLWPVFWMLGNNLNWLNCDEIDIMEYVAWNPVVTYGTLHGSGYCGGDVYESGACKILNKSLANEYHKYTIKWKPDVIK